MNAVLAPRSAAERMLTPTGLTPAKLQALPSMYVHPGQICVSGEAGGMITILGSCVAVCLHDPKLRVGGLNHFLLPHPPGEGEAAGRYGPTAVGQLLEEIQSLGASRQRLVAQIVGGASVLAAFGAHQQHLGLKNVTAARDALAVHRIPVSGMDVGGTRGRKLVFSPRDGSVFIQLIGA